MEEVVRWKLSDTCADSLRGTCEPGRHGGMMVRTEAGEEVGVTCAPYDLVRLVAEPQSVYRFVGVVDRRMRCLREVALWACPSALRAAVEAQGAMPNETLFVRFVRTYADVMAVGLPQQVPFSSELATPAAWNPELPLQAHQLRSAAWIAHTEAHLPAFRTSMAAPLEGCGFSVDLRRMIVSQDTSEDFERLQSTLRARGLLLADRTGSGKTATVLAAVLATAPAEPLPPPDPVVAFATLPSRATLVVVPNNLPKQWLRECARFMPGASVVGVWSRREHRVATYRALCAADVVVTTIGFLTSLAYEKLHRGLLGSDPLVSGRFAVRRHDVLDATEPVFALVHWHRVVYDEVHEYPTALPRTRPDPLSTLPSRTVLGVTGTPPLETCRSVRTLGPLLFGDHSVTWTPGWCDQVLRTLVHREEGDGGLPAPERHVHWVDLSSQEMQVVAAHASDSTEKIVQVASYFNADEEAEDVLRPMEEIVASVKQRHRTRLRDAEAQLARYRDQLERLGHVAELDAVAARVAQSSAARYRTLEARAEATVEQLRNEMAYFERSATGGDDDDDDVCKLCYDAPNDAILRCGHRFCSACIRRALDAKPQCPFCRVEISASRDLYRVMPMEVDGEEESVYGSKLTAVVRLLEEIRAASERAVVFVQWTPLARALRAVMDERGVRCAVVEGNVDQRDATVARLNSGEADAVLLSLEGSASGLNLVAANHVVFVHALVGTDEFVQAQTHQAVSRCNRMGQTRPVHVHWFVTRRTVEEQLLR